MLTSLEQSYSELDHALFNLTDSTLKTITDPQQRRTLLASFEMSLKLLALAKQSFLDEEDLRIQTFKHVLYKHSKLATAIEQLFRETDNKHIQDYLLALYLHISCFDTSLLIFRYYHDNKIPCLYEPKERTVRRIYNKARGEFIIPTFELATFYYDLINHNKPSFVKKVVYGYLKQQDIFIPNSLYNIFIDYIGNSLIDNTHRKRLLKRKKDISGMAREKLRPYFERKSSEYMEELRNQIFDNHTTSQKDTIEIIKTITKIDEYLRWLYPDNDHQKRIETLVANLKNIDIDFYNEIVAKEESYFAGLCPKPPINKPKRTTDSEFIYFYIFFTGYAKNISNNTLPIDIYKIIFKMSQENYIGESVTKLILHRSPPTDKMLDNIIANPKQSHHTIICCLNKNYTEDQLKKARQTLKECRKNKRWGKLQCSSSWNGRKEKVSDKEFPAKITDHINGLNRRLRRITFFGYNHTGEDSKESIKSLGLIPDKAFEEHNSVKEHQVMAALIMGGKSCG